MFVKRSISSSKTILAALLCLTVPQAAGALTILSPQEGATVREKVKIAVLQSAVPSGGFVSIIINGRYQASVSVPSSQDANVVYMWDTKAQVPDVRGDLSENERWVRDGKHEIEVAIHNHRGVEIDRTQVTVRVANKVPLTTPAPPLKFIYKYRTGDLTKYAVHVRGDLIDSTGQNLMGGRPAFTSTYQMGQWIEDVRSDGSSLVRYKVMSLPKVTLMGQPVATAELGEAAAALPPSVYKIIDKYGRTVNSSVFNKGAGFTAADVAVPLPTGSLALGDKWQGERGIKAEGLGGLIKLAADYQLESLEYEGGRACAKIMGTLAGSNLRINFLPGQFRTEPLATVTGDTEVFFDYNVGKVVKSKFAIDVSATVDASAIGSLANAPVGSGITMSGPIFSQAEEGTEDMIGDPYGPGAAQTPYSPYNPYGVGGAGGYGGQPGAGQAASRASVKLRITATMAVSGG